MAYVNVIDYMQFGFLRGMGTTIFTMRQVQEMHQTRKKKLYNAFVDLEKAFNRVWMSDSSAQL